MEGLHVTHCFELYNSARFFHHWIFLVMFHQICQVIKLLSSAHIIFAVSMVTYHNMSDLVFQPELRYTEIEENP